MANIGNAERCNGLEQLGIDLTGTDTQRHCDEKISADQKCKGTDMLAKKRRGVERSSNASHSNGLAQIGSVMNCHEKEKLRAAKKRHCTVGKD